MKNFFKTLLNKMSTTKTTATTGSTKKISRTEMVEVMKNSKGRFMTVTFTKQDKSDRSMNCQVRKGTALTGLGYLPVTERGQGLKNVDPRTLKTVKLNGITYIAK